MHNSELRTSVLQLAAFHLASNFLYWHLVEPNLSECNILSARNYQRSPIEMILLNQISAIFTMWVAYISDEPNFGQCKFFCLRLIPNLFYLRTSILVHTKSHFQHNNQLQILREKIVSKGAHLHVCLYYTYLQWWNHWKANGCYPYVENPILMRDFSYQLSFITQFPSNLFCHKSKILNSNWYDGVTN